MVPGADGSGRKGFAQQGCSGLFRDVVAHLAADKDDAAFIRATLPVQRDKRIVPANDALQNAVNHVNSGGQGTVEALAGAAGTDKDLVGAAVGANDDHDGRSGVADDGGDVEAMIRRQTSCVALAQGAGELRVELMIHWPRTFAFEIGLASVG
jgi:hypothetical protein